MLLTIAVNSYKNTDLLRLCLRTIQEKAKNLDVEIIVSDSATEEDTEMLMREEFPNVRFFPHKKNVGFGVLVNTCLKESEGEYILLLNYDLIIGDHILTKMLDYLRKHPDVGIVGPKIRNFDKSLQYSCFRFYKLITIVYRRTFLKQFSFAKKHLDWFLMKDADHNTVLEPDWLMGSALLLSRKAYVDIGPMDGRFFMYMEDVDWCRRFWDYGYKVVYYPHACVYHLHGKGSARGGFFRSLLFNKLTWIHISSACKYFVKYFGKPLPKKN